MDENKEFKEFCGEQELFATGITETRDLYRKFNAEEFAELSRRLGEARRLKRRGAAMEKEVLELIDTKGETDEVRCAWAANISEKTVELFRLDNHDMIDSRAMKQDEIDKYSQPSLFGDIENGVEMKPAVPDSEKLDGVPYDDDYGICRHKGCPLRKRTNAYKITIPPAVPDDEPETMEVCFQCYMELKNIKGDGLSENSGPTLGHPPEGSDTPILITNECPECGDSEEGPCESCRTFFEETTGYPWEEEYLFLNKVTAIEEPEAPVHDDDALTPEEDAELFTDADPEDFIPHPDDLDADDSDIE